MDPDTTFGELLRVWRQRRRLTQPGSPLRADMSTKHISYLETGRSGRLKDHDSDIALSLYPGPGGAAPDADPDMLRTFFSSRIQGRLQGAQGWIDEEFDRLDVEQLGTGDPRVRAHLIADMQQIIARDVHALTLYYPTLFTAFRRDVFDGWNDTPGGVARGLPAIRNEHALVTGERSGLDIRGDEPAPTPGQATA